MRNFFETKTTSPKNSKSEILSRETVNAKTKLKTKFRIARDGDGDGSRKKRSTKAKNRDVDTGENEGKWRVFTGPQRKEKAAGQPRSTAESGNEVKRDKSISPSDNELGSPNSVEARPEPRNSILLQNAPDAWKVDPFDVLPVPGTPQLDRLFKLYKCGFRTNSIAINAGKTWWSFICNDAALLHATLATWAVYGALAKGLSELQVEQLRHKNEAIKHVNMKLSSAPWAITDELVGAVLTLASFENLLGEYDVAQMHVRALKRMIAARGGLPSFGHNDGLLRGIIWVDFHAATAFHTAPMLPQIQLDPDIPPLPDSLLEDAVYTSPTSLLQLSLASVDLFNIFYRLHRLAIATSSHWLPKVHRQTLSDLLYEAQYTILSVTDYSRVYLEFDCDSRSTEAFSEDKQRRATLANSASVVEALLAAAQIFLYAALRELPPRAKIFKILPARLKSALDRPGVNMTAVWRIERNLNMLLWALVVAACVVQDREARSWWVQKAAQVCRALRVTCTKALQGILETVAWTDVFFEPCIHAVWNEIEAEFDNLKNETQWIDDVIQEGRWIGNEEYDGTDDFDGQAQGDDLRLEFEQGRWKYGGWFI
jgi:hypothetical protein